MWLLNYSADDYWNEDWSNNALHWARRYVRDQINDLRALCGDGTAIAQAVSDASSSSLVASIRRTARGVRKH